MTAISGSDRLPADPDGDVLPPDGFCASTTGVFDPPASPVPIGDRPLSRTGPSCAAAPPAAVAAMTTSEANADACRAPEELRPMSNSPVRNGTGHRPVTDNIRHTLYHNNISPWAATCSRSLGDLTRPPRDGSAGWLPADDCSGRCLGRPFA